MNNPEYQKENLNQAAFEMLLLCQKQLQKVEEAYLTNDTDLAEEVIYKENRVNALDLKIERDCERFIALFNPVATDLRFIMSILKINYNVERIGDQAFDIANYLVDFENHLDPVLLDKLQFKKMFSQVNAMFNDVIEAYEDENTKAARKVFKKDKAINKLNKQALKIIANEIKVNLEITEQALLLFSVIKKLERVGDLLKNISESIIFYLDAEVLVHKKKKGK